MVASIRDARSRGSNLLDVLREMQDTSATPWLSLEPTCRIVSANRAFEALVGVAARQLIGQTPPYEFWPEDDPARFAVSTRRRSTTFLDAQHRPFGVDIDMLPISVARSRPSAFVVRARPKGTAPGDDDSMWAIERLRSLETTLAKVRHELELLPGPRRPAVPNDEALRALSARERQVLDALLHGQRVSDVATDLGIAPNTVRNHVKAIFRKVGVRSQTELLVRLRPVIESD